MSKCASKGTCTDDLVEPRSDKVSRDVSTPVGESTFLQSDMVSIILCTGTCTDDLVEPRSDKVSRDVSTPVGESTFLQSDMVSIISCPVYGPL